MTKYIIRRILVSIPVVLAMILATFAMIQALPGGPFDNVGERAMPEQIRLLLERRYGLDISQHDRATYRCRTQTPFLR